MKRWWVDEVLLSINSLKLAKFQTQNDETDEAKVVVASVRNCFKLFISIGEQIFLFQLKRLQSWNLLQSPTKLITTKAETTFDDKFLNVTVVLDSLPNGNYAVNFAAQLYVELSEFLVKVGIALPTANGKYETLIKNSVHDICKYYSNKNSNMILRLFFNGHFGNKSFPSTCPVKPDFYFMEGFMIDENFLTIRTVETKFLVLVDLCTKVSGKLKCFVNMKFFGEVKDRKKWEKEIGQKNNNDSSHAESHIWKCLESQKCFLGNKF